MEPVKFPFIGGGPRKQKHGRVRSTQIMMPLELQPRMDAFERLLWWLFAGSVGARSRIDIVYALREQPRNAQQLSEQLGLDYTTVRHHLSVLEKNRILLTEGEKYGKVYFLSETMDAHWAQLEAILDKTKLSRRRDLK